MSYPVLSVEEAAQQLELHPKTVLRYIRSGRLSATRVGKSYRILRSDLDAFAGFAPETPPQWSARTTSITDLSGLTVERAEGIATFLQAAAMTGSGDGPPLHLQTAFDSVAKTLKIVMVGSPSDVGMLLEMLHMKARP